MIHIIYKRIKKVRSRDMWGHEIRTPLSVVNSEISLHEEITIPNLDKWLKKEMTEEVE